MVRTDLRKAQAWGYRHKLRVTGKTGSLLWGYHAAAQLGTWNIRRQAESKGKPPQWTLTARVVRIDPFQSRQRPLIFTAPRHRGFWCWPIIGDLQLGTNQIRATLGQPEQ